MDKIQQQHLKLTLWDLQFKDNFISSDKNKWVFKTHDKLMQYTSFWRHRRLKICASIVYVPIHFNYLREKWKYY